jgi:hypothetical protein
VLSPAQRQDCVMRLAVIYKGLAALALPADPALLAGRPDSLAIEKKKAWDTSLVQSYPENRTHPLVVSKLRLMLGNRSGISGGLLLFRPLFRLDWRRGRGNLCIALQPLFTKRSGDPRAICKFSIAFGLYGADALALRHMISFHGQSSVSNQE